MVEQSDTGYTWVGDLPEAYAGFACERWGLRVDPARVYVLQDVMRGVLEVLQAATSPGDGVVVNPPVYTPFFAVVEHIGRTVVEVPLVVGEDGRHGLDLAGLEQAFRAGARAYLLCSPHNPVGRVWDERELRAVVELCTAHDVLLLVDEIHAPLVHDAPFVPIHAVPGAEDAVSFVSASKAWNLAGLKCALVSAASERGWKAVESIGVEVGYGTGILGVAAARAAFRDGVGWLDDLRADLEHRRVLLADLLAEQLPAVGYRLPEATYLAWLDCRALGLPDPYQHFLRAGVALEPGTKFGTGGDGFVRLNFACSADVLEQAVTRMARSL
jgi:cystathionine beta-lyase